MAKLKIFDSNNPAGDTPSVDGYINVANGLLADLDNFEDASDRDRSNLLQGYAGPQHIIYQLTRNPETNEPIDPNNCKVTIASDERKKQGGGHFGRFGKHNLVLPERLPSDSALDPSYLLKYVQAIVALYGSGGTADMNRACRFLFGVMLLTRCR